MQDPPVDQAAQYARDVVTEGEHWDNFTAKRLLLGEIPGSIDFRLFFTQLLYEHNWQPPSIGPIEINFRRREIRYIIDTALRRPGARVLELGCGGGGSALNWPVRAHTLPR
jgi:hypothetical protein